MNQLRCSRCSNLRATEDNFCRHCGHQFTVNLPAVRPILLPLSGASRLPRPLVSSVAVLAVGTGLEWLARRLAKPAARAAGRALINGAGREQSGDVTEGTIDEVLYVRKVQLRR